MDGTNRPRESVKIHLRNFVACPLEIFDKAIFFAPYFVERLLVHADDREVALRIEVDDESFMPHGGQCMRQVECESRFANSPFVVEYGYRLHAKSYKFSFYEYMYIFTLNPKR